MRIKYKILILINDHTLRHSLFREFEDESDMFYAARFDDILAEIKWQELDAVVIDTSDADIDVIGVVQLLNTVCPSVGVVLLSEKENTVLDQLVEILPQTKLVISSAAATKKAKLVSPQIRAAIRQSKRVRSSVQTGFTGVHYAESYHRINEHLIVTMMGLNEIAAEFQLNRDELSVGRITKMEGFCTELDILLSKYKSEEDSDEDKAIDVFEETINA